MTARDAGLAVILAASGEGGRVSARRQPRSTGPGGPGVRPLRRTRGRGRAGGEMVRQPQPTKTATPPVPAPSGPRSARPALAVMTACAVLVGCAAALRSPSATVDPDLVR